MGRGSTRTGSALGSWCSSKCCSTRPRLIISSVLPSVKLAPEVLECHMVAGGFDYLVKARLADMTAYRRFLGETLLSMPGVRETRTYAVMEEIKRDAPLPVD